MVMEPSAWLRRRLAYLNPRIEDLAAYMMPKPSKGSTFFKDCLVQLSEQNTAAAFISFYQDMLPYVQTVQLFKLHKESIFSKLVSGLQTEPTFSLEPILSLIAALSKDLKEDFIPFLPQVVNSFVILLNDGGQKDPEIIEQIFKSWSKIMNNLKYSLRRDIEGILRDTLELRYYPNDIVTGKMSESMSPFLRLARPSQLERGIRMILSEVAEQPERAASVGLLYYDMTVMQQKS